uniref:FH2 domain-containing protein n=1 Tax=Brassica oleracea TaxID=3712 RepID=A0A3P6EWM7_BRAOL|nr:unnamed protein product [Brassica oleracea]
MSFCSLLSLSKVACKKLKKQHTVPKLLETVLKTGNIMNVGTSRGDAQSFKLDTFLKLSNVKGTDGKTTLLHFVVREIIRSEGVRTLRLQRSSKSFSSVKTDDSNTDISPQSVERYRSRGLQVVSGLTTELEDWMDKESDFEIALAGFIERADGDIKCLKEAKERIMVLVKSCAERADGDIKCLKEAKERIMVLVKSCADCFHGKSAKNEIIKPQLI